MKSGFTKAPNDLLVADLSALAKIIVIYFLGKPPKWKPRTADLVRNLKEGEYAIKAALKELREKGYAQLTPARDAHGRVVEWIWRFSPEPDFLGTKPEGGFPLVANHPRIKKELSKKESKDSLKRHHPAKPEGDEDDQTEDHPATWKPSQRTKSQQLRRIAPPEDYPSEDEFNDYLEHQGHDGILQHRPEIYETLCSDKWHKWDGRRWNKIYDWQAYVTGLENRISTACDV